jgi:hypothetical protein
MSAEQDDTGRLTSPSPPRDEPAPETLTDLIDRMDREAFRRALEQRELRVISTRLRDQR